jgi:thioredoxin-like negative regulator of GroEL
MSTITAAASASATLAQNANLNQTRQAFSQLSSALQSGDLSAAQSAYNTLTQSAGGNANGPFAQALQQIGNALQTGDTDQARQALAQLQQQMQSMRAHHGGGHRQTSGAGQSQADASQTTATSSTDGSSSSTSTNLVDVTA